MARPRRPYRTLTSGCGTPGMKTIVTALKDVNLTSIDGETHLKAGETKIYDGSIRGRLRTSTQRVAFNNLITCGYIACEVTDDFLPVDAPVVPPALEQQEDIEDQEVEDQEDQESEEEDIEDQEVEDQEEESEEHQPEQESTASTEQEEEPAEEDELSPQGENLTPADPLLSLPTDQEAVPVFKLTEDERRKKLIALEGLGQTIVDQILAMENPTVEGIQQIRRFPKTREGLAEKVLEILGR